MLVKRILWGWIACGLLMVCGGLATAQTIDPLPSWNDCEAKRSIIAFTNRL